MRWAILAERKTLMPKAKRKRLPVGRIKHAYKHGVSILKIAARYNCSYMGVRLLLIREGVFAQR